MRSNPFLSFVPILVSLTFAGGCQDGERPLAPPHSPPRFSVTSGEGTWTTKASMPTARSALAADVVGGVLYAVGGSAANAVAIVQAYDPATNAWTTKAPMPTARWDLAAGVVNGILYAVGGHNGTAPVATVEAYNPTTNTWTTKASMPTARFGLAIGVVNGVLYAVGGSSGIGGIDAVATVEAYNPTTNTWTTKASMPTARFELSVGVANGTVYAIGGSNSSGQVGTVQAYNPATNTWTAKASLPTARAGLAVGAISGVLYAVGGTGGSGNVATVDAYDPATNAWTAKASMPTARYRLAAGVTGGVLFAVGGNDGGCCGLATVEAYQTASADEPVFNPAAGDVMIFEDNMERYTTPHDADTASPPSFHPYFPDLYPNNYAVINPGRGGSEKGLRLVYEASGQRFLWKTDPENTHWYSPPTAAFVVQYWFRISKNGGPGGGPGYEFTDQGMKWIEFWPYGWLPRTQFGVTAGTSTTGPLWHVNSADHGITAYQPVGPYWNQLNDNQWHRATYLYQPASSDGSSDGIARMWIDGTKIVDVSAAGVGVWCTFAEVQKLDSAHEGTGTINLGEYLNGGSHADLPMALDFDDFKWWKLPARVQ
jgi:hypothetical protein